METEFIAPIKGKSMWPLINEDHKVSVQLMQQKKINTDDIGKLFVFKNNNEWICHRFLGFQDGELIFKGDYSTACEKISHDMILGKVDALLNQRNQRLILLYSFITKLITFLHYRYAIHQGFIEKRGRHLALILTLIFKPLFYKKS